jgi:hypothetical protein
MKDPGVMPGRFGNLNLTLGPIDERPKSCTDRKDAIIETR